MSTYEVPESMIDRAKKGTVIPRHKIEPLIPPFDDEEGYRLRLMAWQQHLERALRKAGKPMTTRIRESGGSVALLTDAEASDYNRRRHDSYLRRARRRHNSMLEVDPTRLDDDERRSHERSVCAQAAIQASIETARRELRPVPHQRRTPIMATPEA